MITKRRFVSLACAGGLTAILPDAMRAAGAQPASRMLVGFGPGGAIDVIARTVVEGMKGYSSSFIVENRPGAGGRLALGALKGSPADGSVMILAPASGLAVFPHVYKTLGYDAFRDFVPVTTVCSFPFLITVGPMVPAGVRTLADFVKWCSANPRQATYGTAAAGSMLHFTGVTLAKAGQFEFVHLPYAGPGGIRGSDRRPNCRNDLSNRHRACARAVRSHSGIGDNRAAAIAAATRCAHGSGGRISGAGGRGVVWRLRSSKYAFRNGEPPQCGNPDRCQQRCFKTGMAKLSVDPAGATPKEFAQLVKSDFDRWGPIVQASGFTPED